MPVRAAIRVVAPSCPIGCPSVATLAMGCRSGTCSICLHAAYKYVPSQFLKRLQAVTDTDRLKSHAFADCPQHNPVDKLIVDNEDVRAVCHVHSFVVGGQRLFKQAHGATGEVCTSCRVAMVRKQQCLSCSVRSGWHVVLSSVLYAPHCSNMELLWTNREDCA
jgi:hypothetical protein